MDKDAFDELLERGRNHGSGAEPEFVPEWEDDSPAPDEPEDDLPIEGEIIETAAIEPYKKPPRKPPVENRVQVQHPKNPALTCWYYPDTDDYRSDGSDGMQPGWFVQSPPHPAFQDQMFRTGEDGRRALQQGREKKRAALERGVKAAVAEKKELALEDVSDEDALEYTAEILTTDIVLNEEAPARERWQFFIKMLEVNKIIDATDVKGTAIAIQVNVDPAIGKTFS